ncbi:MAG: low specificity L-threonine aldolase, partial [Planctomycetaceae bacterium]|nr:low specificity L-threonine aldolase [Planctomycetaceae bacterium]
PAKVETNLVFFELHPRHGSAAELAVRMKSRNVNIYATGPQRLRACTHLDVTKDELLTAAKILRDCVTGDRVSVEVPASLAY